MKRAASRSTITALLLSFLFLTTPLATTAQVSPATLPGISVVGHGSASAPAETATIAIMLGSGDYYKDPAMMEEQAPTPPQSAEEMTRPVIDALAAAGVPAAEIEVITDPSTIYSSPYGAPMQVTLRFTIADPTSARIGELLAAAIGAASESGLFVNMSSALYSVADCASLQRGAREAAIADAREQATLQAELLGLGIGDVIASRDGVYGALSYETIYMPLQLNGCTMNLTDGSMSSIYNAPPFDPSVEPMVTMTHSVELTFEIAPAGAATPTA